MKRALILVIGIILVVGCSNTNKATKPTTEITTIHCSLSPFSSVVLGGDAKIELVNGPYAMDITGVKANTYKCKNSIKDQELYIDNLDQNISGATIKISTPALKKITVTGNAELQVKDVKNDKLTVIAKHHGAIKLDGQFNIDKILQYGKGRIDIDWIKSNNLIIKGYDNGPISLAGKASMMVVKLVNEARLYARYFRSQETAVVTADNAQAEVLALENLNALAVNNSSIYYYKKPKGLTVVTKDSGKVLQLDSMP